MDVLLDLGTLYLIIAGLFWIMSFIAWLMDAYDYRKNVGGDIKKVRWWFRNVYTLGLLWLPMIGLAIFRSARITITGERRW